MSKVRILSPTLWLRILPITGFVLAIFFYWFAIADRYAVFLYEHLGATPFDGVTSSRYWMAGLVATGFVLCGGVFIEGLGAVWAHRRGHVYRRAPWWAIWFGCSLPLVVGIPTIVMNVNEPTLPPLLAAACVAATLSGLALALPAVALAATDAEEWVWSAADGMALLPLLITGVALTLPVRGLVSWSLALAFVAAGLAATLVARVTVDLLRLSRRRSLAKPGKVMAAGFCWAYLVLPLLHHLLATPPGYRYITTASNFFAAGPILQSGIWLAAFVVTAGVRSVLFAVHHDPLRRMS